MTADEIAAVRSSFIGSIDHFGASEGTVDTALYRIYHSHDDYSFLLFIVIVIVIIIMVVRIVIIATIIIALTVLLLLLQLS
jgi:hypothetical protein